MLVNFETSFFEEYEQRIETEFKNSEVVKFIQDLRNFTLHRHLPPTSVQVNWNFTKPDQFSSTIRLIPLKKGVSKQVYEFGQKASPMTGWGVILYRRNSPMRDAIYVPKK